MYDFGTRAVHGGMPRDEISVCFNSLDMECLNDELSANENKTKLKLEKCIASLEQANYDTFVVALCFPSGTAAITSVCQLLESGDHVVMFDSVYHGTRTYITIREAIGDVNVTFADLRDPSDLPKYLKKNIKMIWIETPCNPTMKLIDIAATVASVKKLSKAFVVVDNTFMTPYYQNPLLLGADISMHSLTKYMNGHTDVLMGAVALNDEELFNKLKESSRSIRALPSPMDCYLVLRGLKTLHLRMERHKKNATRIAHFLEKHPNVERVFYPGLESHPQHDLAIKQCKGFNGMVSFCIIGGADGIRRFTGKIKVFTLAGSLGGVESLVDITSIMTAKSLTKEKKEELGISDNLIRLSVGLESAEDLISDLEQALQ